MFLGIDYGAKRIGLAMGDKKNRLALPFKTLSNNNVFFNKLQEICRLEKIEKIIIGIPFPLQGEIGKQVEKVKNFIIHLKKEIRIPIETIDERFSTREVESHFVKIKKEMKKVDKDAVSATIILQSYFDKI